MKKEQEKLHDDLQTQLKKDIKYALYAVIQ